MEFQLVSNFDSIRTGKGKISVCGQMSQGIISTPLESDVDQVDYPLPLPVFLVFPFFLVADENKMKNPECDELTY